jgi:transcriptional regulator GlxA family with amidase domain
VSSSELRNDKTGCPRERPAEVGFLLVDGFSMLAYAAAVESLRAANQIAGRPFYRWHNISTDGHPSAASNGIPFQCKSASDFTQPLDYLFVCASDTAADFRDPHTFAWLRALASKGTKLGGISGGAFLLARAGLLKNRRVTLHWVYAPAFSEEFPEINLRRSLYEIDGDRITCGGGMSPLDMMHALLGQQHGEDLAVGVSEFFLHTDIREGQKPQRLSFQARLGASHRGLIRALEAMENAL